MQLWIEWLYYKNYFFNSLRNTPKNLLWRDLKEVFCSQKESFFNTFLLGKTKSSK